MRPHPRIRKAIKWGGAAVTVLLVAAWIGSAWYHLSWRGPAGFATGARTGRLRCGVLTDFGRSTLEPGLVLKPLESPTPPLDLLVVTPFAQFVAVPIWWLCCALALPTAAAWRLDAHARRRARVGLCPTCRYDRAGLPAGAVCPECGAMPA